MTTATEVKKITGGTRERTTLDEREVIKCLTCLKELLCSAHFSWSYKTLFFLIPFSLISSAHSGKARKIETKSGVVGVLGGFGEWKNWILRRNLQVGFEGKGEGHNLRVILGVKLDERGGLEGGFIGGDERLGIWDFRVLEFEGKETRSETEDEGDENSSLGFTVKKSDGWYW